MHIRLLEDDPALREALVVALSDCGVAVMPASARWNYAYGSNRAGAPGSCMVQ